MADDSIIKPITFKSIDNVSCTRIFSNHKLNKIIQQQCKEVLRLSMIRTDEHRYDEVGRLFSIRNPYDKIDILGKWDDKIGTCIINTNIFEYDEMLSEHSLNELVFIHNHPNNSDLSLADIKQLLYDDEILAVIAIGNTSGTYYLSKTKICSYSNLYKNINNTISKYNNISNIESKIRHKIIENAERYGLLYGKSRRRNI